MALLVLALALLGLGWNFGLISGTAAIVDATTPQSRAKTQGAVDVLIGGRSRLASLQGFSFPRHILF